MLKASWLVVPQNSCSALKARQTFGRDATLNKAHIFSTRRWLHLTPAGVPSGIPGIGEDIEITMQHAPHPGLQFMPQI
jgi:hypothetical protein